VTANECLTQAPPVGTMIAKRQACTVMTEESSAEARRQLEYMRDQQERTLRKPAAGSP